MDIKLSTKIDIIMNSATPLDILPKYLPDVFISDYFFVSYSHEDYKLVYKDLLLLQNEGLQIWYDRGIPAGKNWKENADKNIFPYACKGVLFYLSENSLKSEATIKELKYAKELGKPLIVIKLDNQSLSEIFSNVAKNKTKKEMSNIMALFPEEVLYLTIDSTPEWKKEKIFNNLKELPKVMISNFNGNLYLDNVTDTSITSITSEDINFAVKEVASKRRNIEMIDIQPCAFANSILLESVDFSSVYIRSFSNYVFKGCARLKDIKIRKSKDFVYIADGSFYGCEKLESFGDVVLDTFHGSSHTFYGCESLKIVNIDCSGGIGSYAFAYCTSLKEVNLKNKFVGGIHEKYDVEESAFYKCSSLESLAFPEGLRHVKNSAFKECKSLKTLSLPSTIESFPGNAIVDCDVLIKNKYQHGFYLGNEENPYLVLIGNENIGEELFLHKGTKVVAHVDGNNFKKLHLSKSIFNFDNWFFYSFDNLEYIEVNEENEKFFSKDGLLYSKDGLTLMFCPPKYNSIVQIDEKVKYLYGNLSFCFDIKGFEVDENNKALASVDGILYSKDKVNLITIPSKREGVSTIPKETTAIRLKWWNNSPSLTIKVDKDNPKYKIINSCLIEKDSKLLKTYINNNSKNCVVPKEVEEIGEFAFFRSNVESVTFEEGSKLKVIHTKAFSNPRLLKEIIFPESLESIDLVAFTECDSLEKVILPRSLKTIDGGTFSSCQKLKTIIYRGTKEDWKKVDTVFKDFIFSGVAASYIECLDGRINLK